MTALLAVVFTGWATSADAKRLALLIGNDSYQGATPLQNARSDARAVAAALQRDGFTVTLKEDLTLKAMKAALRSFKDQISGGDEAVFYFSGHGVQFDGTNYLIPIDLVPEDQEQVADESVPLQRVLDDLADQKTRFALAIVDACRDNPFKGTGRAIGGRGLAPVTAATGQMVLYSAGAGQEALDRLGPQDSNPNGVFTRVLITELNKPGVAADQVLKNVRNQVVSLASAVNHEQVPALYDQSIGDFYFVPAIAASPTLPASSTLPAASSGSGCTQTSWSNISPMSHAQLSESQTSTGGAACSLTITTHLSQALVDIATPPSHGKLIQTGPLSLVYQPSPGFHGTDYYVFHYCGSNGQSSGCATLNYTVQVQ